jgi:glutamate dehydrogenase
VLANEAVNRCGPLMLRDLALEHRIDDTEVVKAWAKAWAALHLAPVFDALDADALVVPRDVSVSVDNRTRALQRATIEGVLSLPPGSQGLDELSTLFAEADESAAAKFRSEADGHTGLPPQFAAAWKAVEIIESQASFLFAAVSVPRPEGMSLLQFLQVGTLLRQQVGIDTLELGLKLPAQSKSQEQLRNYALQSLRRAQQRLLLQVIEHAGHNGNDMQAAVDEVTAARGLTGFAPPTELEQAMLDVWALSEGLSPERLAA